MRYLILGAGGMAGHMISNYLIEEGEYVEGIERRELGFCKTYVLDVTNFSLLKDIVYQGEYDYIINCIGLLNQFAEENIPLAILLNSYLPHYLVEVTSNINTRIIQMSTDCVFSGKKGKYTETDFPDGETFYDRTKALGEINDKKNLTFRNSIIGPDTNKNGIGLLNWFMSQTGGLKGYQKSIWTGVSTLTLAKAMHKASYCGLTGIYNLVNNQNISKYDLLELFNKYSNKNLKIEKINGIIQDKSLYRTRDDFSFVVPSYDIQVKELYEWIDSHKEFYPHYITK